MSNWTVENGIREIIQNAIDSETDGHKMSIKYSNNTLEISNEGTCLTPENLLLGGGNKTDDSSKIGGFCEGFKIALVVLLRNSIDVKIYNNNKLWTPKFDYSNNFNTEILMIEETDINETHNLEYVISGITQEEYNELLKQFPIIENDFGDTVETDYGNILLDKKFKGKIFVNGLFVQRDDEFEFGYNFYPEYVQLDRDRKAVNYYELLTLTSQSLITAKECNKKIFNAIANAATDCSDILDVIDEANDDFLEDYIDHLVEKKDIDEINDVIIATEQMAKYLNSEGYNTIIGTEVESYLFAKYKNEVEVIEDAKETYDEKDKIYKQWLSFRYSVIRNMMMFLKGARVSNKKTIEFFNIYRSQTSDYNSLYDIKDQIIDDFPKSITDEYICKIIEQYE